MNTRGSIIPVVGETLDIMPNWLKNILFLALLVAVTGTLSWLTGARGIIDSAVSFIGSVFGIDNLTFTAFVVIAFLLTLAIIINNMGG